MEKTPAFQSIQALRAGAALLVVVFHLRIVEGKFGDGEQIIPSWLNLGYAGVDLFFVISGFVMATIAKGRYGSVREAGRFLWKRAWRVIPPYWLYTTVVVILMALVPHMVNTSYQNQSVLASYLLWPQPTLPLLTVGWTLVYEAYFYLVMALAISSLTERWIPYFLAAWGSMVAIGWSVLDTSSPMMYTVFSPMTFEFIGGAMVALYWNRLPKEWGAPMFWLGAGSFVGAMLILDRLEWLLDGGMYRVPIFGVASILIIAGAVRWEAPRQQHMPRWVLAIGNSSYSLYLSHVFVISAAGRLWQLTSLNAAPWQHVTFVAATVLACIVTGMASFRWIERPLLDLGKAWSMPNATKIARHG